MVTITANDSSSEFISCVRRGPFAIPDCASGCDSNTWLGWLPTLSLLCLSTTNTQDEGERIEYLLSRKRTLRAPAERHSVYHVLSYQRRLNVIKHMFFARGSRTPLGYHLSIAFSACAPRLSTALCVPEYAYK